MGNYRYSNSKRPYRGDSYKRKMMHERAKKISETSINDEDNGKYYQPTSQTDYANNYENKKYSANENNYDVSSDYVYTRESKGYGSSDNVNSDIQPPHKKRLMLIAILLIALVVIATVVTFVLLQTTNSKVNSGATSPTLPQSTTSNTEVTTTQPTTTAQAAATSFNAPNPTDDNSEGMFDNSYYIWNNSIYELFYGSDETAKRYADAINGYADSLGSDIKTYTMLIPSHIEMGLPSRFISDGTVYSESQSANIGAVYKNLNSKVTPINCYNNLAQHCNEYIYFNTDHHWTGLGAYYAYEAFAKSTGQQALSLDKCTKETITDFTGSLLNDVSSSVSSDYVDYYTFPYETSNDIYYTSNGEPTESSVYYEGEGSGSLSYGVFIWGDQPLEVLHSDRNTGKKIAIVKESFGNPLSTYFTYNYDEVHVIDFRYWEGNLKEYCQKNGITEVLFANGVMSANTGGQIEAMDSLF